MYINNVWKVCILCANVETIFVFLRAAGVSTSLKSIRANTAVLYIYITYICKKTY